MSGALVIRGGRVVDPTQEFDAPADVVIEGGEVTACGLAPTAPENAREVDAAGLVVVPGLIDMHVHLREPGQEYKETIESGARAAAAGGFTAVACMPNTDPVNDEPSLTEFILKQAERAGWARVYPIAAVSRGLLGRELTEFGAQRRAGAVAVSDDGRPVWSPALMRQALRYARHFDLPVIQHAEELELSGDGVMHEGRFSTRLGVEGIPGAADDVMVSRDLLLAADTGGRYHLAHMSTARSLELIRTARADGHRVTCEVSAHHLLLTDEDVFDSGLDPDFKMHPPLRSAADRDALVLGLADGSIDAIASDHAPHHPDEKELDFVAAPNGIVGLETTLSLCLDRLVAKGVIDLARLVDLLSTAPARILGVAGGSLAPGSPGDVTLIDLEREVEVDPAAFRSRSRNTPFAGWKLRGGPAGTVIGGRVIELP
jgi:dihydroorotase